MSVSNYIRECKYRLGGLKPYIYLISKDSMKVDIKAKGVKVSFKPQDECVIHKVECALAVYNQEEEYDGRFRFSSTLDVTINEMFSEPFFQCLKTLRENQFYIVVEDKEGTQYLINAELYTKMEYEYTFTDASDQQNTCVVHYSNLSNHPLLIMEEMLTETDILLDKQCNYNIGHTMKLWLTEREKLNVNDDGVKATALYVEDADHLKTIDFLPQSFNYTEIYNGKQFETNLSFSIPLEAYQYYWSYDLIEFKNNVYGGLFHTTNNNYIVAGAENGLFPKYSIETSEDDGTPNLVTFEFTAISQYPTLWTDSLRMYKWVDGGKECFGYNRYAMLKQQYTDDFGNHWLDTYPLVKKKNELIEPEINSEECGYEIQYRWVDNGVVCIDDTYYGRLSIVDGYICEGGNKYSRCQLLTAATLSDVFVPTDEYVKGDLIARDSTDCTYVASRWVEGDGDICEDVDESYTKMTHKSYWSTGYTLYESFYDLVSSDGDNFYASKDTYDIIIEENSCNCGYSMTEFKQSNPKETECGLVLGKGDKNCYTKYYEYSYCPRIHRKLFYTESIWIPERDKLDPYADNTITFNSPVDGYVVNINGSPYTLQRGYNWYRPNTKEGLDIVPKFTPIDGFDFIWVTCGKTDLMKTGREEWRLDRYSTDCCNGYIYSSTTEILDEYCRDYDWVRDEKTHYYYGLTEDTLVEYTSITETKLIEHNSVEHCDYVYPTIVYYADGTSQEYRIKGELDNRFASDKTIIKVEIGSSVTGLGNNAFQGCSSLTSITMPNSVTSIGNGVFNNCTSLSSITISDNVTTFGSVVFGGCTKLSSVKLPNGIDRLDTTFSGCTSLTSVTLPDSLTLIGFATFSGCTSLSSITIPSNVTEISSYAFYNCSSLTEITMPSSVTKIGGQAFYSLPLSGTLHCNKTWYDNLSTNSKICLYNVNNWVKIWQ